MRNYFKIGVVAPTGTPDLDKRIKNHEKLILEILEEIGKTLAGLNCEIWINSDKGALFEIVKAYKKYRGKKLVALCPKTWPDILICLGLSPKSSIELACISCDQLLKYDKFKKLGGITHFLTGRKFPPKFKAKLEKFILYTDFWELKDFLTELKQKIWFERKCKELQEIEIFCLVKTLSIGVISPNLRTLWNSLMIAEEQLKRFSVKNPEDFQSWYAWWDNYLTKLSPRELKSILRNAQKKKDVSKWRPEGHWGRKN